MSVYEVLRKIEKSFNLNAYKELFLLCSETTELKAEVKVF